MHDWFTHVAIALKNNNNIFGYKCYISNYNNKVLFSPLTSIKLSNQSSILHKHIGVCMTTLCAF